MPPLRLMPTPATVTLPRAPAHVPARFDIHRTTHAIRPATPRAARPIDPETIVARLEEAGHTLLCLTHSETDANLCQARHRAAVEALGAYPVTPGPRPPAPPTTRITRMDQALSWIAFIPSDRLVLRRIVGCRCLIGPHTRRHLFTWRRLARLLGADHRTIQRWHGVGIDIIAEALNRDAAMARAWDRAGMERS